MEETKSGVFTHQIGESGESSKVKEIVTDPLGELDLTRNNRSKAGKIGGAIRWLRRELDEEGIPRRLAVDLWWPALGRIAALFGSEIPEIDRGRIEGFVRTALRFSEPGFAPIFGGDKPELRSLKSLVKNLGDVGVGTVMAWWGASPRLGSGNPPPLPAYGSDKLVLAMLRADWNQSGDLIGIDQRKRGGPCQLAMVGRGRRILGGSWSTYGSIGASRPIRWASGMHADLMEWSFRVASTRITRTVVLLRGRHLALLADQVDGPEPIHSLQIDRAEGVEAEPMAASRAIRLRAGKQVIARILPIGLPAAPYVTERGSLAVEGQAIVLKQQSESTRRWLPLLFSWNTERDRRVATWRRLTVAERSKPCPVGVAFAVRVSWGIGEEGIVIYRSLARPTLRSFLGHQTTARFLIGSFSETGTLTPLVSIDD